MIWLVVPCVEEDRNWGEWLVVGCPDFPDAADAENAGQRQRAAEERLARDSASFDWAHHHAHPHDDDEEHDGHTTRSDFLALAAYADHLRGLGWTVYYPAALAEVPRVCSAPGS